VLFLLEKISWLVKVGFIDKHLMVAPATHGSRSDSEQGAKLSALVDEGILKKIQEAGKNASLKN